MERGRERGGLTCIAKRYILIFFVTIAITNSCTAALRRKVTNAAWNFENLYVVIVDVSVPHVSLAAHRAVESRRRRTNVSEEKSVDWDVPATREFIE